MSAREIGASIRAEFKAKRWNSRAVSVRVDLYSMGSTVYVTVRKADVPLSTVREIAMKHESVRRDHTGEILSGGNTFVRVDYAEGVVDTVAADIVAKLETAEGTETVELGRGWQAWRLNENEWAVKQPNSRRPPRSCWGIRGCSRYVAREMLDSAAEAS